jgi:hypothetical protein
MLAPPVLVGRTQSSLVGSFGVSCLSASYVSRTTTGTGDKKTDDVANIMMALFPFIIVALCFKQ